MYGSLHGIQAGGASMSAQRKYTFSIKFLVFKNFTNATVFNFSANTDFHLLSPFLEFTVLRLGFRLTQEVWEGFIPSVTVTTANFCYACPCQDTYLSYIIIQRFGSSQQSLDTISTEFTTVLGNTISQRTYGTVSSRFTALASVYVTEPPHVFRSSRTVAGCRKSKSEIKQLKHSKGHLTLFLLNIWNYHITKKYNLRTLISTI